MTRHYIVMLCAIAIFIFQAERPAVADSLPPGSYLDSCNGASMRGGTLTASCTNYFGALQLTTMANADDCNSTGHDIANVNGDLRCIYLWDPNGIGIISRSKDEVRGENKIKVWRIDQPYVVGPLTEYRDISFKAGDTITVNAGGCVQTGGWGATWKSYTYPQGDSAAAFYSGTIRITGVIDGPVRIAGTMGKDWKVRQDLQAPVLKDLYLQLGYQDNDYSDDGYYAHDDGNNNQCANVGPAWVEIKIVRPLKTPDDDRKMWSPASKPFDIVYDGEDTQGLPLNPRWYAQKEKGDASFQPDFVNDCGPAISGGNTIDYNVLNERCTSQMPYTDLDTSPFLGWFGYCTADGILHGHLDWAIATTMGKVQFTDWSTGIGHDDDYDLTLTGKDNSILVKTESGLGLEFNSDESIAQFQSPWWANLYRDEEIVTLGPLAGVLDPQGKVPTIPANSPLNALQKGLPAVVIGLIGIDGVHRRGATESHPVFALGVETDSREDKNSRDETWAFFVRNSGNEGNCSELTHYWEGLQGKYYVQLPSPPHWEDVTDVSVATSDAWLWSAGDNTSPQGRGSVVVAKDSQAMYLEVSLPPAVESGSNQVGWGINGDVTIHYNLKPNGSRGESKRDESAGMAGVEKTQNEAEVDWQKLQTKIQDAAVKQRVEQIFRATFPGKDVKKMPSARITIDPKVHEHKPVIGAHHGGITRPHRARDPRRVRMNADLREALPATASPKNTTGSKAGAKSD